MINSATIFLPWADNEGDGGLLFRTGVIVAMAGLAARRYWRQQQQEKREKVLDDLIAAARLERDRGKFHVLALPIEEQEILSAAETTKRIRKKTIDILKNIVFLSQRCRHYGRSDQVNAITEELYDEAYRRAEQLLLSNPTNRDDQHLFGVPISVKDCIAIKGTFASGGMACRLRMRSEHNSLVVDLLNEVGAIPLCRGNAMQLMYMIESHNRIWGRTCNPWDLSRTPGGSSGGDAALVAMDCVPLAVSTDLGGSIRVPASFCGVVGFKPTSNRVSAKGNTTPRKGDRNGPSIPIPSSVGPIARTVEDCALFMKAVCVPKMWEHDKSIPPLPFDDKAYTDSSPLRIGYFKSDSWFEPCAAAQRGLEETIKSLIAAGHTCVPFEPPADGKACQGLMTMLTAADGNLRMMREALEGEPMVSEYDPFLAGACMSDFFRWIVRKFLGKFLGERSSYLLGCATKTGLSVYDYWQLLADLISFREQWSDSFSSAKIDALIFPALPVVAMPHGMGSTLTSACSYMFIANLLQWPSGVVPVTLVKENEQEYELDKLPKNQQDRIARLAQKVMRKSIGLPLSISVMTPKFRDETCLRVMREVEKAAQFKSKPKTYLTATFE